MKLKKTLGVIAFALTLGISGAASAHEYQTVNSGMPFFNLSIFSVEPQHVHYRPAPRPVIVRNYYYEDTYYRNDYRGHGPHDKHHDKHDDHRGRGHGHH